MIDQEVITFLQKGRITSMDIKNIMKHMFYVDMWDDLTFRINIFTKTRKIWTHFILNIVHLFIDVIKKFNFKKLGNTLLYNKLT